MGTKFSTTDARNQRLILVSYASVKSTARARDIVVGSAVC